jgi:hypothetical protein
VFTTVRDVPPAVAVIITDVAFVACQLSVTLCPLLIELLLAENVKLTWPGGPGCDIACDPQPVSATKITIVRKKELINRMKRMFCDFMRGGHLGPSLRTQILSCWPELLLS